MERQSEEVIRNTVNAIAPLDGEAMAQAKARQDQLTKPRGSLGRLEQGIQGDSIDTLVITTSCRGFLLASTGTAAIARTMSSPSMTCPKTA